MTPAFHAFDSVLAIVLAIAFIAAASLLKEPAKRNFNVIMIAGASAAYLSGGGMGKWEFLFTAVVSYCAYRGLQSYAFIGLGWLLHVGWDIIHHVSGHPIIPFQPMSSFGCAITDTILAIWFFAGAPSVFRYLVVRTVLPSAERMTGGKIDMLG